MTVPQSADEQLEWAHRAYVGRLVGWLFRMTGDLQIAEDAVAAAFASAVPVWRDTMPDSPEAWLRTVSRNHAVSLLRAARRTVSVPVFDEDATTAGAATTAGNHLHHDTADLDAFDLDAFDLDDVDDRLPLLFVCAHPAIDARLHAPLMLQTVLGIDAARIAGAFLVPPSTMGQRLSRAKAKIRDAGIRYRVPAPSELPARVGAVLQAVYAAYGLADDDSDAVVESAPDDGRADDAITLRRAEAVRLARMLTELLPAEPEAWGLLGLLLHTESRRPARLVDGVFVPLADHDVTRWSPLLRAEAERALRRASRAGSLGRFQLEGAISAAHSARLESGRTPWESIVTLYSALLDLAPSVGAAIGAASARIEVGDLEGAAELLDSVPIETVLSYQPYWVCRAHLARHRAARVDHTAPRGPDDEASALERAIGLTTQPAIRDFLTAQLAIARGRG